MARLIWDQVGERFYETGVDRGVLYLPDGTGVPWNGLISVNTQSDNVSNTPLYFDGQKTYDLVTPGEFAGSIKAFTYPEEFSQFEGIGEFGSGMYLDNQDRLTFDLTYRTLIGNDEDGPDHGYKIHILYNLTAVPEAISYNTIGSNIDPVQFGWRITSVPEQVANYNQSGHVILDSREINVDLLALIEEQLYGSVSVTPNVVTISELIDYLEIQVINNGDGTWTAIVPDYLLTMINAYTFEIEEANAVFLTAEEYAFSSS